MTVRTHLPRQLRCGVVIAFLALALWTTCALAHPPQTVRLKFHLVTRDTSSLGLASSGSYVGYTSTAYRRFVLINDQTGHRTVVNACHRQPHVSQSAARLGFPWIAFDCSIAPRFRLYNIVTQTWRSIACRGLCGRLYYLTSLAAVGARWLALSVEPHDPCGDGVHNSCGPTRYLFYSIATGRRVSPTIGPRTFVDLNAAKLTRRLCEPLHPVTTSVLFPQTVTLDDGLAVVEEQGGIFVERCKSPRRVTIVNGAYAGTLLAGSEAAVFCAAEHLNGIFLPSELRFVATLPSGMTCGTLGPRHLYVTDPTGKIWAARLTAPRQR